MIEEVARNPGVGIGKPERLVGDLSGHWSRRIDQELGLVHTTRGDDLVTVAACYHY